VYPPFLRWLVRGPGWWEQIDRFLNVGAVFDSLKCADVPNFQLRIPPIPEQRTIAHILGTLDDRIELNRRMNEGLEAIARALFKSWFVDFDPVRAKSEGRDPGLPPHLAGLFPDSFEHSELGKIPKGWRVRQLGEIVQPLIGGDWGSDASTARQRVPVRCLRGVDLHALRMSGSSSVPLRFLSEDSLRKREPSDGDVIIEGSGECGRSLAFSSALASALKEPIVYSNFCKRIRVQSPAHAVFVEWILNELVASGEMRNFVTGTAMPNLDLKGLLGGLPIAVPPPSIVDEFASRATLARIHRLAPENGTLATIRDTLLPRLVSGDLRIDSTSPHGGGLV
jgi:type I restriction enzyme S subunit